MTNLTLKKLALLTATLTSLMAGSQVIADTHGDIITAGEVVPVKVLKFPTRGMTTGKVENELGQPNEIIPAVGQPPISR